jgi:hypothetical protein
MVSLPSQSGQKIQWSGKRRGVWSLAPFGGSCAARQLGPLFISGIKLKGLKGKLSVSS